MHGDMGHRHRRHDDRRLHRRLHGRLIVSFNSRCTSIDERNLGFSGWGDEPLWFLFEVAVWVVVIMVRVPGVVVHPLRKTNLGPDKSYHLVVRVLHTSRHSRHHPSLSTTTRRALASCIHAWWWLMSATDTTGTDTTAAAAAAAALQVR